MKTFEEEEYKKQCGLDLFLYRSFSFLCINFFCHYLALWYTLLLFFFSGVVLGAKCLSRRDEAGSQPSEDQFWPLPWGVGCNVGGCQEAVWFGCGFVSFLFHFPRINNFALLLSFYSTRCCSFF